MNELSHFDRLGSIYAAQIELLRHLSNYHRKRTPLAAFTPRDEYMARTIPLLLRDAPHMRKPEDKIKHLAAMRAWDMLFDRHDGILRERMHTPFAQLAAFTLATAPAERIRYIPKKGGVLRVNFVEDSLHAFSLRVNETHKGFTLMVPAERTPTSLLPTYFAHGYSNDGTEKIFLGTFRTPHEKGRASMLRMIEEGTPKVFVIKEELTDWSGVYARYDDLLDSVQGDNHIQHVVSALFPSETVG